MSPIVAGLLLAAVLFLGGMAYAVRGWLRGGRLERMADPTRRTEAEIRRDWPPAPTDPPK